MVYFQHNRGPFFERLYEDHFQVGFRTVKWLRLVIYVTEKRKFAIPNDIRYNYFITIFVNIITMAFLKAL